MNANDCAFVDRWLDDWIAGRLPDEAATRIEAHAERCERCRRLESIVRAGSTAEAAAERQRDADDRLVAGVLENTSGGGCRAAEELLPAFVDEDLDSESAAILQSHLSHCGACSELVRALRQSKELLPELAEAAPPIGFAERVLMATSRAPRRSAFEEWWLRVLARPRASMELAYAATLLMVILFGNPVAAFRDAGGQATRLVESTPVVHLARQLPDKQLASGMVAVTFHGLVREVVEIRKEISGRWQQARLLVARITGSISGTVDWLMRFDLKKWLESVTAKPPGERPAQKGDARADGKK